MFKRSIFTLLFVALALAAPAHARVTVSTDALFGTDGTVVGEFGPAYYGAAFTAVVARPDGSLLASRDTEANKWLHPYNAAGAPTQGEPVPIPSRPEAVDSDGKTIKAFEGFLERFNPDGTPDPSFGVRPYGERTVSDATGFKIEAVEPLPSGRILAAGSIVVYEPESKDAPGRTYVAEVAVARFDHQGGLDPSFGDGGVVKLKSDAGISGERLLGLVPRADDGVAVIVLDSLRSQGGEAVTRSGSTILGLGADGRPDPGYGSAGQVRLGDASILGFRALPGGELLVAGDRWKAPIDPPYAARASDIFTSRYTADGRLDPGFGGGDGSFEIDLEEIDLLGDMLVEDDGSITLGGSSTRVRTPNCLRFHDFCRETPQVLRLTARGELDPSFGEGGLLPLSRLAWPYGALWGGVGVKALAARPGGGIFAAGGSGVQAFIAALSPGGAFDPGFGDGGVLSESDPHPGSARARSVAVDSSGRILVAGGTGSIFARAPALFRYLPDGQLDRGFGGGAGHVRVPGEGPSLVVSSGDATYVLSSPSTITKFGPSGRFDDSFGEEGTVKLSLMREVRRKGRSHKLWMTPISVQPLPDGRLLLAGTAGGSSEPRIFALRLLADGSLDHSFGDDGIALLGCGGELRCIAGQAAVQRDGRIVIVGYLFGAEHSEAVAVLRLRADGSRDRSFGHRGLVVVRAGRRSVGSALAIEGNGRILVAGKALGGHGIARELLFRLTATGGLDRGFGRQGMVNVRLSTAHPGLSSQPRQLLLSPRRILVLRDDEVKQLVVYSRDGHRRQAIEVAGGSEPEKTAPRAPFGALRGGRLLLGWNVYDSPSHSFRMQRLSIGGAP